MGRNKIEQNEKSVLCETENLDFVFCEIEFLVKP